MADEPGKNRNDREVGAGLIEARLKTLPESPGVYRMIDRDGKVLYVGKAKNLKKRVSSYAKPANQSIRIQRMIAGTVNLEVVTTHTEAEALLLEANLIKTLKPRYNILLRDDKSFPLILIGSGHAFPRVYKHRGTVPKDAESFGPFASVGAVNQSLATLQRAFLLRTCSDSVFGNRTRPCLLYQIKRCSAPCVEKIAARDYAGLVSQARGFLKGDSQKIQKDMAGRMETASEALDYEEAAALRDRIAALTRVQQHQDIHLTSVGEADVIALSSEGGSICVQVFFFRGGANYGNRAYFPSHGGPTRTAGENETPQTIMAAFIGQFYDNKTPPPLVLVSHKPDGADLVAEALSIRAERKVSILVPKQGDKAAVVQHAADNAREALTRRLLESAAQRKLLDGVADVLGLDGAPRRIEIYDNSHVSGTNAIGAMVVAGPEGFMKKAYRKFNIKDAGGGDDYAMMREVLERRFSRAIKEDPDRAEGTWPDLVLVDGGKGQLSSALQVFSDLGIDDVPVAAIAKGPDRHAGREVIYQPARAPLVLDERDPTLYFLQRIRDEAHRFAIGGHRTRRARSQTHSPLDEIAGIGPKRKKALLHHFGSARAVAEAGLSDLEAVDGISHQSAEKIYGWFHTKG